MSSVQLPERERSSTPIIAGFVLALLALLGVSYYRGFFDAPTPPPAPRQAAAQPPAPIAAPQAPVISTSKPSANPSFDIVRVTPEGHAVIAGRAAPGAEVTVRDGDQKLAQTRADNNGEFVLVPDAALKPGGRELTLSARGADGQEVGGTGSVVVLMQAPEPTAPQTAAAAPTTILLPNSAAPPRLLQMPGLSDKLALNSVDYSDHGDIRFAGSAKPSAPIRLYVDNKPVGETSTNDAGQWTMVPPANVEPGVHRLRVDQLGTGGRVLNRVELPFQRTATPVAATGNEQAIVQPGQNLWRIARRSYGVGTRYTVIYLANREQIRDPNLIYPGQVFAVPTATP